MTPVEDGGGDMWQSISSGTFLLLYVKVLPWPTNLNNIVHTTTTNSEPLSGNIIDCVPCIVKGGKQKYVNQELNTRDCMFSKVMVILQQAANLFDKYERKRKQLSYLKTIFFH